MRNCASIAAGEGLIIVATAEALLLGKEVVGGCAVGETRILEVVSLIAG
jgi:hypothetical protein